jgi:hypothetical protein
MVHVPEVVDSGGKAPLVAAKKAEATGCGTVSMLSEEPWVLAPNDFSAPSASSDAFTGPVAGDGRFPAIPGFLGKAVGSVHDNLEFWTETFEHDSCVMNILKNGYRIPVKMTAAHSATVYREHNNQSARLDMDFVRAEVKRLVEDGQVVRVDSPPVCINPLSVAFKVNADGAIKKHLVIDLIRWVNTFIIPDKFKMSTFQDALAQSAKGDYQSVFNVSKAYHRLRLAPESYGLVGFCVMGEDGKEVFYHYVLVVFGLGPAGQALGRVMRPILVYLMLAGVRNIMYVDDGRTAAASKAQADKDYATTLWAFQKAGFDVSLEKSDKPGDSQQRKEYLGYIIDTNWMIVEVPGPKLARIRKILGDFLKTRRHKVQDIASVVVKLVSLEPALGRSILVRTRLATIAIVAATEVSDAVKKRSSPWSKFIDVKDDIFAALYDVWKYMGGLEQMSHQVLAYWDSFMVYPADGGHSVVGQEGPG